MRRQALAAALTLAAATALAAPKGKPTPTPTIPGSARLSGGFGRPQTTPVARAATGQSLADVVHAASEARKSKETPGPGVSITNKSLVTDPNRGRLTTWAPATPRAGGGKAGAPQATPSGVPASDGGTAAGAGQEETAAAQEARWRETARRMRQRVADAKDSVTRLETEAKKLENDFYAWDDGQYRDNVIKPAWDKKREELETARRNLEQAEKDLADLPEKARKAGALPGWIRD